MLFRIGHAHLGHHCPCDRDQAQLLLGRIEQPPGHGQDSIRSKVRDVILERLDGVEIILRQREGPSAGRRPGVYQSGLYQIVLLRRAPYVAAPLIDHEQGARPDRHALIDAQQKHGCVETSLDPGSMQYVPGRLRACQPDHLAAVGFPRLGASGDSMRLARPGWADAN